MKISAYNVKDKKHRGWLKNIQGLWADREVMVHVDIPEGIDMSDEEMDKYFESVVSNRANLNLYSNYNNN